MIHARVGVSILYFILIVVAIISIGALPSHAFADTVGARSVQLIPPGGTSCSPVTPMNFTPYVSDGSLQAFEFTLPDASYVAIGGSAGSTFVPFNFMTRSMTSTSSGVRIHVDINPVKLAGTLPIQVTLLSAANNVVCAEIVSASVGSGPTQMQGPSNMNVVGMSSSNTGSAGSPMNSIAQGNASAPETTTYPSANSGAASTALSGMASSTVGLVSTSATSTAPLASASVLSGACSSATGAYRLWLGLLIIYAVLVAIALWAEFPQSMPWMRSPESVAVAILVVLLLLLGFWYFAVSCRSEFWMPLVAVLIAILGILAAFRNHPRLTQILLLQEETK